MIFPVSILSEDSNLCFWYVHSQIPFLNSHSVNLIIGEALGPIRFCRNNNIICIQEFIWLQEGFEYILETHWIFFPNPGSDSHKFLECYQIYCKRNWVGIFFFFLLLDYKKKIGCCHYFDARFGLVVHVIYHIKIRPFTPLLSNSNHMESLSFRSRASWVNEGTTHSTPVAFITFYHGAKSKKYGLWYRLRLESQLVHSNFCIVKHISHNSCIYPGFEWFPKADQDRLTSVIY